MPSVPGDRSPVWFQRVENATVAVLAAAVFVELDFRWWWLAALFLLFDASMLGYVHGPRLGAWTYNAVHNYAGPAVLATVAVLDGSKPLAFVALSWAFHIGVDRALGYGLKFQDAFGHTHLGWIGRSRQRSG